MVVKRLSGGRGKEWRKRKRGEEEEKRGVVEMRERKMEERGRKGRCAKR